jgi:UDP-N-acetylglucosamine 2-epimerase (non-hydrolysing)
VDDADVLGAIVDVLIDLAARLPLVFPVHPRTQSRLESFDLLAKLAAAPEIHLMGPMGYQDFLSVTSQAKLVITDSGGLQEETTALGVPCLTMRENTERPVTVDVGSSTLVGNSARRLNAGIEQVLDGTYKQSTCPELWDGNAASRIATELFERYAT